jgi:hypothetical protein
MVIGSGYAEGTGAPDAASRNPVKYYNLTQVFKDTYEVTGTAKETHFRTGDPIKNEKERKMYDHSTRMEKAFLFGKRSETTGANGQPLRSTNGLINHLALAFAEGFTTCFKVWSGSITADTFMDATYPVFDYNTGGGAGNERLVLGGNSALNALNKAIKADSATQMELGPSIKYFGMELAKYIMPQGTLYFKSHPLMNIHPTFDKMLLILDMSAIKYRPMRNRDTRFQDNVQNNDVDGVKGLWWGECGLEVHHCRTMQVQTNVTFTP